MLNSITIFAFLTLFCLAKGASTDFERDEIVPDIIDKAPKAPLKVKYEKTEKELNFGNEIGPKDVREQPSVFYDADPDSFYTLLMTDPDAPSRKNPIRREWHHWLVGNIPGANLAQGEILSEYVGAGPPKNTGLHRYVFLLFKQPGKLSFDEPKKTNHDSNRGNFNTKKFSKKYGLGDAIAGNYFQAQYDDSVPSLHKQLGF